MVFNNVYYNKRKGVCKAKMAKNEISYKIGLDIGTTSVGWACIDDDNNIIKKNGKLLWGSRLFDEAKSKKDRRAQRAGRRRLRRRKSRLNELNRIVKPEMDKVDPEFFNKMESSFLVAEDRPWSIQFFNSKKEHNELMYIKDEQGRAYQKNIYHFRAQCMEDKQVDFRLVYLCLHHIMKYRGNFLYEDSQVESANGSKDLLLQAFKDLNDSIIDFIGVRLGFDYLSEQIVDILLNQQLTTKDKNVKMSDLLINYQKEETGSVKVSAETKSMIDNIVKLIVGYKSDLTKIFLSKEEVPNKFSVSELDEKGDQIAQAIGEAYEIIETIAKINSAFTFNAILDGEEYISLAKIKAFNKHKEHLALLKALYKNKKYFTKAEYKAMFNKPEAEVVKTEDNDSEGGKKEKKICANYYNYIKVGKVDNEEFCKFVKATLSNKDIEEEELLQIKEKVLKLIEDKEFMPTQTTTENGAIPMQLHRKELKRIIESQGRYYPTLIENEERLLKLFSFRIPYYYGPLNSESKFSWIVKTKDAENQNANSLNEVVNYLNFNDENIVNKEATQEQFINRMLNTCEYLYGEKCMPKNSITCEMFDCLQELNGLKVNDEPLPVKTKQKYILEVLKSDTKIKYTPDGLKNFLLSQEGFCNNEIVISGTSTPDKFNSSLKTIKFFTSEIGVKLENLQANLYKFDELCKDMTIFKEGESRKARLNKYINILPSNESRVLNQILHHKFDKWSSLSKQLVLGVKNSKGLSILDYLWDYENVTESGKRTLPKLMNLISRDEYGFNKFISDWQQKYLKENGTNLNKLIEESYCSPPVKRATLQTIKIVNEIVKILKCEPKRICVEFSSDSQRDQIDSRYKQLENIYKSIKNEVDDYNRSVTDDKKIDLVELRQKLESCKSNKRLSDEKTFLYFIQLGKSLYSGKPLELSQLPTYEVDHIIPRSVIVDDSIDNKALVLKYENQEKKETCFVEYQDKKYSSHEYDKNSIEGYWSCLVKQKLMSAKKFAKLHTDFRVQGILNGFINRQLVETRQAIKLVIELLKQKYPDYPEVNDPDYVFHRVVAVNASLSSTYRQMYHIYKLRDVNDFHHAHDAYLAGAIGDYIYKKFNYLNYANYYAQKMDKTQNYFYYKNIKECNFGAIMGILRADSIDTNTGEVYWKKEWNEKIRNNIFNQKCFISKKCENDESGEFWGATINPKTEKADAKLVPVNKRREDITKYGGYTNQNMAFSVIVKIGNIDNGNMVYSYKLQPVYKIDIKRAQNQKREINEYVQNEILNKIDGDTKEVVAKLYTNQLLEVNGHPVYKVGDYYKNAKQLVLDEDCCRFLYCIKDGKINYRVYAKAGVSLEEQKEDIEQFVYQKADEVYNIIVKTFEEKYKYLIRADGTIKKLLAFSEKFTTLSLGQKIFIINNLFKFNGDGEINLSKLGYKELGSAYGRIQIKSKEFNFADKDIFVINKSVTGFYQTRQIVVNNKKKNI